MPVFLAILQQSGKCNHVVCYLDSTKTNQIRDYVDSTFGRAFTAPNEPKGKHIQ